MYHKSSQLSGDHLTPKPLATAPEVDHMDFAVLIETKISSARAYIYQTLFDYQHPLSISQNTASKVCKWEL